MVFGQIVNVRGFPVQKVANLFQMTSIRIWLINSTRRYVLKIHFFIEWGLKMIQFKTKSGIFIQKNIHSLESRIFNRNIHLKK